jgi:hypothetical protein
VDNLLQHHVPARLVGQVGVSCDLLEIPLMPVQIAGYYQAALGRQVDQIATSEFV